MRCLLPHLGGLSAIFKSDPDKLQVVMCTTCGSERLFLSQSTGHDRMPLCKDFIYLSKKLERHLESKDLHQGQIVQDSSSTIGKSATIATLCDWIHGGHTNLAIYGLLAVRLTNQHEVSST